MATICPWVTTLAQPYFFCSHKNTRTVDSAFCTVSLLLSVSMPPYYFVSRSISIFVCTVFQGMEKKLSSFSIPSLLVATFKTSLLMRNARGNTINYSLSLKLKRLGIYASRTANTTLQKITMAGSKVFIFKSRSKQALL